MSESRAQVPRPSVNDVPARSGDSRIEREADVEYRREAERLVDEQVAQLFALVRQAAADAGLAPRGGTRAGEHRLTAGSGESAVEFIVEAITDVPPDADPAATFPTSQAVCHVRAAGAAIADWTLRRIDLGAQTITYGWTREGSSHRITAADVAAVLRPARPDRA